MRPTVRGIWSRTRMVARAAIGDRRALEQMNLVWSGYRSNERWPSPKTTRKPTDHANPLRTFFDERTEERRIWKWFHYFDIYNRHFHRFRGQEVYVLEIGIYRGGSLEMWQDYFGPRCQVFGVDVDPRCKAYEGVSAKIYIGDQADRSFWKRFRSEVPIVDIVIDDGGHVPEQQIVSLEELLPHLQPGGVYVCEDVHGAFNRFASYVHGLAHKLNVTDALVDACENNELRTTCKTTEFQSAVSSIHLYPFVTVIERTETPFKELAGPKWPG